MATDNTIMATRARIKHCEQGAALVVGLVVLLMLTLLGVSSMSMTSLELRIAGNTQNKNIAFQVADSANEILFSGGADGGGNSFDYTDTANQGFAIATVIENPPSSGNTITFNTTTAGTYEGVGSAILCPGNSLTLSCNAYELDSATTNTNTNAAARVVQGFVKPGPALGN